MKKLPGIALVVLGATFTNASSLHAQASANPNQSPQILTSALHAVGADLSNYKLDMTPLCPATSTNVRCKSHRSNDKRAIRIATKDERPIQGYTVRISPVVDRAGTKFVDFYFSKGSSSTGEFRRIVFSPNGRKVLGKMRRFGSLESLTATN